MRNLSNFLKMTVGLVLILCMSSIIATRSGCSVYYIIPVVFAVAAMPRTKREGVATAEFGPDVTGIMNYLGQVRPQLFGTLYNNFDIANDITLVPNVKNTLRLTKLLINNGAEPYSGIFEPNDDDIGYSEQDLVVAQWQRDMIIDPRKYRTTYLSEFLTPGSSTTNNAIPFAQYTISQFLRQLAASMNDTSAFFGVGVAGFSAYNPATVYHAGDKIKYTPAGKTKLQYYVCIGTTVAGNSPDTTPLLWSKRNDLALCVGLGTQIKAARDAGQLPNVVSTGAITNSSDAYDQAKAVYRALPDAVKAAGVNQYMARGVYEFLQDDIQDKVGKYTETDESGLVYLANTERKCVIKPTTWQRGSQMIIATPKENLLMGTDLMSDSNQINVIPDVYSIKMGLAGVIGFNFQDAEVMSINDQN